MCFTRVDHQVTRKVDSNVSTNTIIRHCVHLVPLLSPFLGPHEGVVVTHGHFVRTAAALLEGRVRSYTYLLVRDTIQHGKITKTTAAASRQQARTAAQQQRYRIRTHHATLHHTEQLVATIMQQYIHIFKRVADNRRSRRQVH